MSQESNWANDPVVRLEKAVLPAILHAQDLICRAVITGKTVDLETDAAIFDRATEMLRNKSLMMLDEFDIHPLPSSTDALGLAATAIDKLRNRLVGLSAKPCPADVAQSLLAEVKDQIIPKVEAALDSYRAIFIGQVLERQRKQAQQASSAIKGLDKISKQIFFISINASIEAGRAGEAGRGFTQISTDIRALAQSAQDATRNLSSLVRQQD